MLPIDPIDPMDRIDPFEPMLRIESRDAMESRFMTPVVPSKR